MLEERQKVMTSSAFMYSPRKLMRLPREKRLIRSLQYYYSAPNKQPEIMQIMLSLLRRSLSLLRGLSRGNTVDKRSFFFSLVPYFVRHLGPLYPHYVMMIGVC